MMNDASSVSVLLCVVHRKSIEAFSMWNSWDSNQLEMFNTMRDDLDFLHELKKSFLLHRVLEQKKMFLRQEAFLFNCLMDFVHCFTIKEERYAHPKKILTGAGPNSSQHSKKQWNPHTISLLKQETNLHQAHISTSITLHTVIKQWQWVHMGAWKCKSHYLYYKN